MLDHQLRFIRANFPDLPRRAMQFFDVTHATPSPTGVGGRTLMDFATSIQIPNPDLENISSFPNFGILQAILDRMTDVGVLMRLGTGGGGPINTHYICVADKQQWLGVIDFVVYGFPSIIDAYDKSVLQIVVHSDDGPGSGTCFAASEKGLLTAAHCVATARQIGIIGLKKSDLARARIFLARS